MSKQLALAVLLASLTVLPLSSCGGESPQGVFNVSGASGSLQVTCSVSPRSGPVPLTVSLSTAVQGSTPSYSLVVDFGDGTTGTSGNVTHTYANPGAYAVRVVASAEGRSADCQQSVTAEPRPVGSDFLPTLRLRLSPDPASGPPPLAVNFNLCQSGDPERERLQFSYAFGDGRETGWVSDCSKSHTYAAGAYVALLCVSDGTAGHDVCRAVDVLAR